jgi:hypothetical protein
MGRGKQSRALPRIRVCILCVLPFALSALDCRGEARPQIPPARYEAPLPNGGSVFFVGNSFLAWEGRNLPEWVAALGAARGQPFEVGADIVPGDLPLAAFLHHPEVEAALASRKYRVWVVQGHELEPVDHPLEFKSAVRDFNAAITASGGRMVLFMTWEFRWRRFMPQLADAYESIGQELGAPIIPVGLVYRDCEASPPRDIAPFFLTASPEATAGGLHENKLGTAVNAYSTYSILTGRNPLGQGFAAPGNDIDPSMLRYLSDRAWKRAAPRLLRR